MKKMIIGFALFLVMIIGFGMTALAEGPDGTASTPPDASPTAEPTAEPTTAPSPSPAEPTPTPVVDQLIIDSWNLYEGMDKTYGAGSVSYTHLTLPTN